MDAVRRSGSSFCGTAQVRRALSLAPRLRDQIVVIQRRTPRELRAVDAVDPMSVRAVGRGITVTLRRGVPQHTESVKTELVQLLAGMGASSVPLRVLRAGEAGSGVRPNSAA